MGDHESGFLRFIEPAQRHRVETLLELGAARRADLRGMLDHAIRLDPRHAQPVPRAEQFAAKLETRLRTLGAGETCYVIAADADLDGRTMKLTDALGRIIGSGSGAFVSCVAGSLGYFEAEARNSGHLLQCPAA